MSSPSFFSEAKSEATSNCLLTRITVELVFIRDVGSGITGGGLLLLGGVIDVMLTGGVMGVSGSAA